jgi:hypothetical protein
MQERRAVPNNHAIKKPHFSEWFARGPANGAKNILNVPNPQPKIQTVGKINLKKNVIGEDRVREGTEDDLPGRSGEDTEIR